LALQAPIFQKTIAPRRAGPAHLAVLCDYREEGWPSMDLCADMLAVHLSALDSPGLRATPVRPPFRRRARLLPWIGRSRQAHNFDRLLNRFWFYARFLRRQVDYYDLFHVCDHSYAQLVHALPAERTGVFCHDLDAFRCLLEPARDPRPRWFRALARRILAGLQKAAVVFYTTRDVQRQMLRHDLIDPARLVQAPLGVAPEFTCAPAGDPAADALLAPLAGAPYLLHVGSCIPRKRVDVLLQVFAAVRGRCPGLRLLQVGGAWTTQQESLLQRLEVGGSVRQVRGLHRRTLAALYQRAALVLVPSEAEGFGLPLIEALACGQVVVASDLEVFREVGGDAVVYCPVADVPAWADAVSRLLADPAQAPGRAVRLARAGVFSWAAHAATIAAAYRRLAGGTA
jgi:glycosyltransferase involved in cell wall biosynthesis